MKKANFIYAAVMIVAVFMASCASDGETYSEQKEREREVVDNMLKRDVVVKFDGKELAHIGIIDVISEEQFVAQDSTTIADGIRNEYVLFKKSGIYMQIVRKGTGQFMKSGEKKTFVCRFWEYNIQGDSVQTINRYASLPEEFNVSGTFGSLQSQINTKNVSTLYNAYQSTSVPEGWLVAIPYLRMCRPLGENGETAIVRLVVPHTSGQSHARNLVYPCLYELNISEAN